MDKNSTFTKTIAENYEKYFSPMFFTAPAKDIAGRLSIEQGRVLELACGTGQLTRIIREKYPDADIIATDLNPGMISVAKTISSTEKIQWQTMDAQEIQFDDNSFDVVICQFGFMFFPDKQKAAAEGYRVLKPGGKFIFSTWDKIETQHITVIANDIIKSFFPSDPPMFFNVPFSMSDPSVIESLMKNTGFRDVSVDNPRLEGQSSSADDAAKGFTIGNPMYLAICERDESLLQEIQAAVKQAFIDEFGSGPISVPLSLFVTEGVK